MKILAVPNSFKGSRTSAELCGDLKRGFLRADKSIEFVGIPVADGGDGFLTSMLNALRGEELLIDTFDALNRPIKSRAGIANGTGIVEMALSSGLALLKDSELVPLKASSYGTGVVIRALLEKGVKSIVLGIGGSATTDAGTGCLCALGYKFLDEAGKALYPSGEALANIAAIDVSEVTPHLSNAKITVICDVTNPLYGIDGASYIYAPQKGATSEAVKQLDEGLKNFAAVVATHIGTDYAAAAGSGAAGGIGFGLRALAGAELKSGVDTILELCGYFRELEDASLVITGEGRLDEQTKQGKLPMGVGISCRAKGIPCIAICGYSTVSQEELSDIGITKVYALLDTGKTVEYCIRNAGKLTEEIAVKIYRDFIAK